MTPLLRSVTIEQDWAETTVSAGSPRTYIPGPISGRAEFLLSEGGGTVHAQGVTLDQVVIQLRALLEAK